MSVKRARKNTRQLYYFPTHANETLKHWHLACANLIAHFIARFNSWRGGGIINSWLCHSNFFSPRSRSILQIVLPLRETKIPRRLTSVITSSGNLMRLSCYYVNPFSEEKSICIRNIPGVNFVTCSLHIPYERGNTLPGDDHGSAVRVRRRRPFAASIATIISEWKTKLRSLRVIELSSRHYMYCERMIIARTITSDRLE